MKFDHKHIFLSYASQESDFAVQLAIDLRNAGINLWMDRLDIDPGEDWRKSLQDSINDSVAVLAVLSKAFVHSQYCQRELARADRLGYPIVPILLTPLGNSDWPIEIERRQYIDFTQWQDNLKYHQQLVRLVSHLKEQFSTQTETPPDPETRYLTSLIATLKDRHSVDSQVDLDVRPEPFSTFEWNLKTDKLHQRRTGTFFRAGTLNERRTSLTNKILQNFAAAPRLALTGAPGTGKTSLLEYLCLTFAYERQMSPETAPLPILIRLADWADQTTDFVDFLDQSLPFEIALSQTVVFIDGLDEIDSNRQVKIDQVRNWIPETDRVFVTCRSKSFETEWKLGGIPTVTAYNLNPRQVRVFLCSLFGEQRAGSILDQYPSKYLQSILCNPRALNLLSKINFHTPLENVGLALLHLVEDLIRCEQRKGIGGTVSHLALEQALAELAFEEAEIIPYQRALEIAGAEAALITGERVGILAISEADVRFTYPVFRSYFAAVWMRQNGIDAAAIRDRSDFELVILCLAGISPARDNLIIGLYEDNPELALHSLITGVTAPTVQAVLSHWLGMGQPPPDLTTLPDLSTTLDALTGMMRAEPWPVRQMAYALMKDLSAPRLPGIVEMLGLRPDEREGAAFAIKQIGIRALYTLIQHLNHAQPEWRSNVVWALDELANRACVPALIEMLDDEEPAIVIHAIQALGYLRDPDSFPAVIIALGHPHADVRQAAFDILQWVGENVFESLTKALDHPNQTVRQQAITLITNSEHELATETLLKATYDAGQDVQLGAIAALENRETPETIERLIECLNGEKHLREAAMDVLKRFRSRAARSALAEAAVSDKKGSASTAKKRVTKAVTANDEPEATASPDTVDSSAKILDGLLDRLQNSAWGDREEAAKALRDYAKTLQGEDVPHVLNRLKALLKAENWAFRWAAIEPLAWIGHQSIVPDFIMLLDDENWMVRVAAIRGLQEIKDPVAIDALEQRLTDSNNVVREAALEALGVLGHSRAVSAIAGLLDDPDEMLRLAAVQALARINHKTTVRPLLKALGDSDKHVRWMAVHGLKDVADTSAVNGLIHCLKDTEKPTWEDVTICDIAADILERIGTSRAKEALAEWRQDNTDTAS